MEDYRFSDKKGTVFSYSWTVMPVADPPLTYALVDFEGGGRILTEMTDRDLSKVEVGMPVEMTFRKMGKGKSINYFINYSFWAI
jgi:uncharacterized OB-fold protein